MDIPSPRPFRFANFDFRKCLQKCCIAGDADSNYDAEKRLSRFRLSPSPHPFRFSICNLRFANADPLTSPVSIFDSRFSILDSRFSSADLLTRRRGSQAAVFDMISYNPSLCIQNSKLEIRNSACYEGCQRTSRFLTARVSSRRPTIWV